LLARLDIAPQQADQHPVDIAVENPVKMLFGRGYALQTALLWIIYFCSLLNLFLFVYWLPEVLHLIGMTPSQAVFVSSLIALGGMSAVLYFGLLIDRFGPERALALHYAAGIRVHRRDRACRLAVFRPAGGDLLRRHHDHRQPDRSQRDLRQALSGAHAHHRDRVGDRHRLGSIVSPILGGYLLARGLPPTQIFLTACLFALVAAAATALLVLCGRPSAPRRPVRPSALALA
jgi:hypothetical protein